jgi:hypothetical protein
MRWFVSAVFVPAGLALLASCTPYRDPAVPTPAELNAIRQSQNVPPENYRADVIAYMRNYLNDPSGVRGAAISQPALKTLPTGSRYVACMRYDAKKANGVYAGPKTALVVFISGKLDRVVEPPVTRDGRETPEAVEVREACKDAAYAPFPELQSMRR